MQNRSWFLICKSRSRARVRLCLPRRVYTESHADYVVEVFAELVEEKRSLRGNEIVEEAPFLRAFTARLRPL